MPITDLGNAIESGAVGLGMNIASKVFYLQVLARCGYVVERLDGMSSLRGGVTVRGSVVCRGRHYEQIAVQVLENPFLLGTMGTADATIDVNGQSMSLVVHDDGSFDLLVAHTDGEQL